MKFPGAFALFVTFIGLCAPSAQEQADLPERPVVDIPGLGKVAGDTSLSYFDKRVYYMFKGIRFGKSPSGERRFQPPEPEGPWNDTLDGRHFGQKCPQLELFREQQPYVGGWEAFESAVEKEMIRTGELKPDYNQAVTDIEDCLYIHVYTPKLDKDAKMPVMVFYHGGAYAAGSALVYGAKRFMDKDVVLVVPHYRLGPLGFLSLHTDDIPGNAGLLDQVLALEWVRDHISAFGGDPNLVTIFGESAGAASVSYLMLSPLAKGLFHRVIGQSGSALAPWAIDDIPEFHTVNIAEEAGCNVTGADLGKGDLSEVTKCLQTVDAMKLTKASIAYRMKEMQRGYSGFGGCSPIVQKAGRKKYIEKHPLEILKSGNYTNVPILFGANKNEGSLILAFVYGAYMVPNGLVDNKEFLTYRFPDCALKLIQVSDPSEWLSDAVMDLFIEPGTLGNFTRMCPGMMDLLGSLFLKGPQYRLVQEHSKMNNHSYFYAFDYKGSNTIWDLLGVLVNAPFDGGVCHANDLLYLFNVAIFFLDKADEEVSRKMVGAWTNFAYYGEPNPEQSKIEGVPDWLPYSYDDEFYMRIDKNFTAQRDFKKEYTITMDESENGVC